MRRLTSAVVALVAIAALVSGCGAAGLGGDATRPVVPTTERSPAPPVSVPALDGGRPLTLIAHRGTPVILNFWASWCKPCQQEMPALIAFSEEYPDLDVLGIAVNDDPSDSRRFATRLGIPFELGIDRSGAVAESFGATGLPVTVIIDEKGLVADTFFGEITRTQLDGYAEQLGL